MSTKRYPTGRSSFDPNRKLVGQPSPQSDPDSFSVEDIEAEVKYLMRANRKYGANPLRTAAYLRLMAIVADRKAVTA